MTISTSVITTSTINTITSVTITVYIITPCPMIWNSLRKPSLFEKDRLLKARNCHCRLLPFCLILCRKCFENPVQPFLRRCNTFTSRCFGVNYLARLLSAELEKRVIEELVESGERLPQRGGGKGDGRRAGCWKQGLNSSEKRPCRPPAASPVAGNPLFCRSVQPTLGITNVCSSGGHSEVPEHLHGRLPGSLARWRGSSPLTVESV